MMLKTTLMLAGLLCSTAGHAQASEAGKIRASKIILVGDSTVAVQSGWGPSFCTKRVTSFVACLNLGRGGRSTSNYRSEGSWDVALAEMTLRPYEATYVLIQFGHNDQPGKPGRSTDLVTQYPANLKRYVSEVRAAGGIPVLVTPLTRRQFSEGKLIDDLAPWAEATRQVAAEMRVPLVDLHARSKAAVQTMGAAAATRLAQRPPSDAVLKAAVSGTTIAASTGPAATAEPQVQPNAAVEPMGQAKLAFDYTHLGPEGADFFSAMVVAELARVLPALRRNLIP
jgi:lysophospholipase L1-like esterase